MRLKYIHNKNNRLDRNGEAPIYLEVYFDRNTRKFINTEIYVPVPCFQQKEGFWVVAHSRADEHNKYLRDVLNTIYDLQATFKKKNKQLSVAEIEFIVKNPYKKIKISETFNDFARFELENDKSITDDTRRAQKNSLRHIDNFKPDISFEDLNYELVQNFNNYLIALALSKNSISKHHAHVKKYVNLAVKKKIIKYEDNPYLSFKIKQMTSTRENINIAQFHAIQNLSYPITEHLERTRLTFLFCCCTGLRFSDVSLLTTKMITKTQHGYAIDVSKMKKVDKPVYIPLSLMFEGYALEIMLKFVSEDDLQNSMVNKKIFPNLINSKLNEDLKVIAYDAGVSKNLTFHMSRHTFGTFLADLTGDPYLIKDLMGHSKIDTSMYYIHASKEANSRKLMKVDWSIYRNKGQQGKEQA